jgi:DNA-binding NtrC family response regulator
LKHAASPARAGAGHPAGLDAAGPPAERVTSLSRDTHTVEARSPESARPSGLGAKLVVVEGPDEGLEAPIDAATLVGNDDACHLVLHDPAVSRKHASFAPSPGGFRVKDLGSRNGTLLGGARIVEAELPLGALLRLGNTVLAIQPRWYVREVSPARERRFGELIGESTAMRTVFAILQRVAPTDLTVLVEGESGTGKELVARSIHQASPRASAPYVVFHCGAVPGELAESELFGHVRGAFSGAVADRMGAFQRADGGTLCLDEIGELPPDLQPKLLRVLESGEVRAVGDDVTRRPDVRVVAATNRDLRAETRRGRFRSDLLYRLEVVSVRLPPLRQRPEDVPLLVAHLLAGKLPEGDEVGGATLAKLVAYGWPGNVRELRNVLLRAVALATKPGGPPPRFADLPINLGPAPSAPLTIGVSYPGVACPMPYKDAKAQLNDSFDRAYLEALLARHGGNVSRAAAEADVSRKHLYEMMRRSFGTADPRSVVEGAAPPDDDA